MNQALLSPASALVAHIEPLVTERRVLVIGSAERSLAEHLLERGARLVQLLDPDPRRVAQAAARNSERRVSFAQLTESALRDGSFDIAIVEDVNLAENLDKLVSGVARSLNPRGIAVFCASNTESTTGLLGATRGAVDYDALMGATDERFEAVRIFGQSPFLGYSVVDLELEHPPEPALDNAYLEGEGESADYYIALCGPEESMRDLGLEEMSIVQLPAARFVENSEQIHREREMRAARRIESLENDLRASRKRASDKDVERLTRELQERDTWIHKLESRAESADARADDAGRELEELEEELEQTHKLLVELRKTHETQIAQLKTEAKKSAADPKEVETLQEDIRRLRTELDQSRRQASEAKTLKAELEKAQKAASEAKTLKAELEKAQKAADEAKHLSAGHDALEDEVNALDEENQKLLATLKDKARAQEKLERRLAEAEKELDDLHDQLDETEELLLTAKKNSSEVTVSEIERDLRALEEQLKKRGERVSELERQLQKLETYAKTLAAELTAKNGRAEGTSDEIGALSKALAEREADLVEARWTIGQLQKSAIKG